MVFRFGTSSLLHSITFCGHGKKVRLLKSILSTFYFIFFKPGLHVSPPNPKKNCFSRLFQVIIFLKRHWSSSFSSGTGHHLNRRLQLGINIGLLRLKLHSVRFHSRTRYASQSVCNPPFFLFLHFAGMQVSSRLFAGMHVSSRNPRKQNACQLLKSEFKICFPVSVVIY